MAEPERNIKQVSVDFFSVRKATSNGGPGERERIHREQIQAFFNYDRALHRNGGDIPEVPAGYHLFREAYHRDTRTRSRFAFCKADKSGYPTIRIPGPSPTKEEVLGSDCDLRSHEEIEGGKVLTGSQADTVNSMLWDAADRLRCQKDRNHQGYVEHRERREDRRRGRGPLGTNTGAYIRQRTIDPYSSCSERRSGPSRNAGSRLTSPNVSVIDINHPSTESPEQPIAGPSCVATDPAPSDDIATLDELPGNAYEEYYEEVAADESMNVETSVADAVTD